MKNEVIREILSEGKELEKLTPVFYKLRKALIDTERALTPSFGTNPDANII